MVFLGLSVSLTFLSLTAPFFSLNFDFPWPPPPPPRFLSTRSFSVLVFGENQERRICLSLSYFGCLLGWRLGAFHWAPGAARRRQLGFDAFPRRPIRPALPPPPCFTTRWEKVVWKIFGLRPETRSQNSELLRETCWYTICRVYTETRIPFLFYRLFATALFSLVFIFVAEGLGRV